MEAIYQVWQRKSNLCWDWQCFTTGNFPRDVSGVGPSIYARAYFHRKVRAHEKALPALLWCSVHSLFQSEYWSFLWFLKFKYHKNMIVNRVWFFMVSRDVDCMLDSVWFFIFRFYHPLPPPPLLDIPCFVPVFWFVN